MKISQEVRDYADELGTDINEAKQKGMDEMSKVFKEKGGEVYIDRDKLAEA